jgi:uncharacterized protein YdgA (DUF945 family)
VAEAAEEDNQTLHHLHLHLHLHQVDQEAVNVLQKIMQTQEHFKEL